MPTADPAQFLSSLETRLSQLTPTTSRHWGQMTAHEMVCHLSDSFLAMMGERDVDRALGWSPLKQRVTRFVALQTPLPWPKGVPTLKEVNPHREGTKPLEFERDRTALLAAMRRFVAPDARYAAHPMFGTMPRRLWMLWTFRHVDHHLRQFGL
jgi:hypothetical protein